MEFLKHLKEDSHSKKLIDGHYGMILDSPFRTRFFENIIFNNDIILSIQASGVHNSKPSRTLTDLNEYEAFELGIKSLQIGNYVTADFATADRKFSKLFRDYFDGSVYNNVPRELVESIFQKLKEDYGLFIDFQKQSFDDLN